MPQLSAVEMAGALVQRKSPGILYGEIGESAAHLCVDMQRLFIEASEWRTPWMERVAPQIVSLLAAHPERAIFTRFIPVRRAKDAIGTWRRYYDRWPTMTLEQLAPGLLDLIPDLNRFAPPAPIVDKRVYSPWLQPDLPQLLASRRIDTLIVSGGETDVCVLSTVLGAVDRGYRVIIAADALCSSADETHDALMTLYANRYGQQVELAGTEEILSAWNVSH